jgi:hypothetical protein
MPAPADRLRAAIPVRETSIPTEGLALIASEINAAGDDLTRVMALIGSRAGPWVEMRHVPAIDELDGWRPRANLIAYLMREALFFPQTFEAMVAHASAHVADGEVVVEPLSLRGTLLGEHRLVDIRYRITLRYDGQGRLCRITGALTPDNVRQDVITWLRVIDRLGGLGQTPAFPAPIDTGAHSTEAS